MDRTHVVADDKRGAFSRDGAARSHDHARVTVRPFGSGDTRRPCGAWRRGGTRCQTEGTDGAAVVREPAVSPDARRCRDALGGEGGAPERPTRVVRRAPREAAVARATTGSRGPGDRAYGAVYHRAARRRRPVRRPRVRLCAAPAHAERCSAPPRAPTPPAGGARRTSGMRCVALPWESPSLSVCAS